MLGYSRREVDEFLREVRKELRLQSGGSGEVRILTPAPDGESAVSRMMRMAAESADQRAAEAVDQAEKTVRAARELADRIAIEAEEIKRQARTDADKLLAEARTEYDRILSGVRVEQDRILADARRRGVELERQVAEALDNEVRARLNDLTRTHTRLVTGLSGMRDALIEVLAREADQGPVAAMVPTQSTTE